MCFPAEAARSLQQSITSAIRDGSDYGRTVDLDIGADTLFRIVRDRPADPTTPRPGCWCWPDITDRRAAEQELRRMPGES